MYKLLVFLIVFILFIPGGSVSAAPSEMAVPPGHSQSAMTPEFKAASSPADEGLKTKRFFEFGKDKFNSGVFSPDNKLLLVVGGYTIQLIDVVTGKNYTKFDMDKSYFPASSGKFSPDGKWIALSFYYGYYGKVRVQVIESVNFGNTFDFESDSKSSGSLAFSPDSKLIAIGDKLTVRIFQVGDWKLVRTYKAVCENSVQFTPDGKKVICADYDEKQKLFPVTIFNLEKKEDKPEKLIYRKSGLMSADRYPQEGFLIISPDGETTIGQVWKNKPDNSMAPVFDIWPTSEPKARCSLDVWSSTYKISQDNKYLILMEDKEITFYRLSDCKKEKGITLDFVINSFVLSSDGSLILANQLNNDEGSLTSNIFSVEKNKILTTFSTFSPSWVRYNQIEFSEDNKHLNFIQSTFIKNLSIADNKLENIVSVDFNISAYAFTKDHKKIILLQSENSGYYLHKNTIHVLSLPDGKELLKFIDPENVTERNFPESVTRLTPDDKHLIIGDKNLRFWDIETGKLARSLPSGNVSDFEFSPDGSKIAVANLEGTVRLFNLKDGKSLWTSNIKKFSPGGSRRVVFNPAGETIVSSDDSGNVVGINVSNVKTPYVFTYEVNNSSWNEQKAVFLADGETIFLSHGLFSTPGGNAKLISDQGFSYFNNKTFISPDGKTIIRHRRDNKILAYSVE